MKIQIAHLYPELLSLYGDRGNIASLSYRLKKRGIECEITEYGISDNIDFENTDIIYLGGGTDKDRYTVLTELLKYKDEIKKYVEDGKSLLAVCSGFELLGKYYKTQKESYEALGILDIACEYDKKRHIGNVVLWSDILNTEIVGFENHNAKIDIGNLEPLGKVITGFGNDGVSGVEGAIYKNVVATFLHGPILPKNPVLCDYIIANALERKYGNAELSPIDDTLELKAHDYIVKRFSK